MRALIAVLPGDGIGPEVVLQGERVLQKPFGHAELADSVLQMLGRLPSETVL